MPREVFERIRETNGVMLAKLYRTRHRRISRKVRGPWNAQRHTGHYLREIYRMVHHCMAHWSPLTLTKLATRALDEEADFRQLS